jgi:hypothetical protein
MKKLSHKYALLLAVVTALGAFTIPAVASAASWGVVGTNHTLTSQNLAFNIPAVGAGWTCTQFTLGSNVQSASVLTVTSAAFTGCAGTGSATGCVNTVVATGLPWRATGTATTNVTIHNINADLTFEGASCSDNGLKINLTGTLSGGVWDATAHPLTYSAATGLTAHFIGVGSFAAGLTGSVRDDQQTLTLS